MKSHGDGKGGGKSDVLILCDPPIKSVDVWKNNVPERISVKGVSHGSSYWPKSDVL